MRPRSRILLLEDDSTAARALQAQLEALGYRVVVEAAPDRPELATMQHGRDERRAHALAERAQGRTSKLLAITAALSRALTAEQVARIVLHETLPAIAATTGFVLVLDASGTAIANLAVEDPRLLPALGPLALESDLPACTAARTGEVVWLPSRSEIARRTPRLVALCEHLGVAAWGAVPLLFEGRTVGSLALMHTREVHLSPEDQDFLLAIGQQCAQAIERARLYEATVAARARAEEASNAKDEFLAMLGHELRNPLAPIVTALQLMKLRGDTRSTREQEIIERHVQHLVRLVEDLLDVSRITRGKVRLERRPVDLGDVVARAIEMASPLLEQRSHRLDLDLPRQPLRVLGDETRLAQALANVLTNAAKYTEPSGQISVAVRREPEELVVVVRDNGIGIPADLLPRVFDLFQQGSRPDYGPGGLGIGLTLARNLVALHGGSVTARSDGPGQGSEFAVRLPAHDLPDPEHLSPETGSILPARKAAGPRSRRVLIVDDNVDAAVLLAEVLHDGGHEIVLAHDAPDALAVLDASRPPDLAILDIGLPVMDGYELAGRIRDKFGPDCPTLVALTGYGQHTDRDRALSFGFTRHFVKPVDTDELLAFIDSADVRGG